MAIIHLETTLKSSLEICFDLSRSIDLHTLSTQKTKEIAIDGKISGLIGLDEFVTWEATHFGIRQKLTTKITAFNRPFHFRDEQIKGIFKSLKHDHIFSPSQNGVIMKDVFEFEAPLGWLGKIVEKAILTNYLRNFLIERNDLIKYYAETDLWKKVVTL